MAAAACQCPIIPLVRVDVPCLESRWFPAQVNTDGRADFKPPTILFQAGVGRGGPVIVIKAAQRGGDAPGFIRLTQTGNQSSLETRGTERDQTHRGNDFIHNWLAK